jgi:hypothetical protein
LVAFEKEKKKNERAAAVCVGAGPGERLGEGARTFNRLDEALEY